MASSTQLGAYFIFPWKIEWQEFRDLRSKPITKNFITSYKNVSFHWKAEIKPAISQTGSENIAFNIFYERGPLPNLKNVNYVVSIMNKNEIYETVLKIGSYDAICGKAKGAAGFDGLDLVKFQKKHDLDSYNPLFYKITFKIPSSAFTYYPNYPFSGGPPSWLSDQYKDIRNPQSKYSDVQLISADNKKYYCHRNVLGFQAEGLEAMFRHPTSQEEKEGVFRFPFLRHEALEAVLEYLYTGETLLSAPTAIIVEVADFAEQYGLIKLKESCAACLWDRVAQKWQDCILVAAFADLHDDLKCLKDRAFDVLVDNYEKVPLEMLDFSQNFANSKAKKEGEKMKMENRLRAEFYLHMYRRENLQYLK